MVEKIQRNHVISITTLLDGWSKVVRIVYRQLRRDGTWQQQDRDMLDRGHGVTVLLHNSQKQTVLLLRQPRIIATISNFDEGETIEACNGLIEDEDPRTCALREVEEETGHRVKTMTELTQVYASPGASLELVYLFLAGYDDSTKISQAGGNATEGEDIELIEVSVDQAMRWVRDRIIRDARTILALHYAYLYHNLGRQLPG